MPAAKAETISSTTTLTGGEALVRALAAHAVDTVFGIPGTHNLAIYAALAAHGIRHVSPRHEQGAGYAADGYARATGRPGVVVTTTGPAVLNAATALAQAYSDSVPVLLVSPGMPLTHPAAGNGELHEVKDQSGAMDRIVAVSRRVTSVGEIPAAVAEAFATMTHARPRPVHLEIPLDLLEAEATAAEVAPIPSAPAGPDPAALSAAADALAEAERPVLLVGGGARRAAPQVLALAHHIGAPVVASTNGKGVLPEDDPLSVGAGLHLRAVVDLVADSDVAVAVGTELAPADVWRPLALDERVIRIDVDPTQAARNARPHTALIGDAGVVLTELLGQLGAASTSIPPVAAGAADRAASWRRRHREEAADQGAAWLGLCDVLHDHLGRDGVLVGDSTMACYYGALANLPRYTPASFAYPTGLGTLGYAVPAATGVALGRAEVPVVALSGDGGLMFTVAELAAAAEARVALPVVVVDNGGYGEIDREMHERGQASVGVALGAPDLPAAARAFGCEGRDVADLAQLREALASAARAARPTLLRIPEAACRRT
ncbi:MAG: 5-guanidino-2-oxopentanoate decarboxylase [Nitriliruptoraceae bacterium]